MFNKEVVNYTLILFSIFIIISTLTFYFFRINVTRINMLIGWIKDRGTWYLLKISGAKKLVLLDQMVFLFVLMEIGINNYQ